MGEHEQTLDRRRFLGNLALGAGAFGAGSTATSLWTPDFWVRSFQIPGAFAEELVKTPKDAEGPFYPDKLPLDTDNDLLIINDKITPAVGKITHFGGRVLDLKGNPVRGAVVEIWQCDSNGVYLHSKSDGKGKEDKNFQGYGRFLTGRRGEYYFRTIRPVPYGPRTPHIHMIVKKGTKRLLTTQIYDQDQKKRNEADFLYKKIDPKTRHLITVKYEKVNGSKIGEVAGSCDIVVGLTPEDE